MHFFVINNEPDNNLGFLKFVKSADVSVSLCRFRLILN